MGKIRFVQQLSLSPIVCETPRYSETVWAVDIIILWPCLAIKTPSLNES